MPLDSTQTYHGWQLEGPPCFSACLLGVVEPERDQDKLSCTKLRMNIKVRIEEVTRPRGPRTYSNLNYQMSTKTTTAPMMIVMKGVVVVVAAIVACCIYNKLYDLSIPDCIQMDRILDHALSMAKDHDHSNSITNANNATSTLSSEDNCKVVRTAVSISVKVSEQPPLFPRHTPVPATAWSIVNLKRKRVVLEGETCVICFEEIRVGSQATLMPCSHLYHRPCIREWLYETNFCPICRFALPPDLSYRAIEMVD